MTQAAVRGVRRVASWISSPADRMRRSCSSPSSIRRSSRRRRSRASGCSSGCATAAAAGSRLVACPAGFGKSTLLAAWRERESARRPVAWVTLDEGDDDAGRAVVARDRGARPRLPGAARTRRSRRDRRAAPLREVRAAAARQRARRAGRGRARPRRLPPALERRARESVAWFVDHLPATVQLVLSTRADPALPLGALRARGELLELRADDLRFTAERRTSSSTAASGSTSPPADVELLVARTEGWPAGIYLAALSLAGTRGQAGARARVRRHERARRRLPRRARCSPPTSRSCRRFMLRTSVLERLCAPLCDAVLGRARVGRRARRARAHEPVPAPARRPAAAGSASTTCSRSSCASSSSGASRSSCADAAPPRVRVARDVGHDRRGDPPRASRPARSPRPAR